MKIVVDINHPGHVHYFKNFIWEMQKKGHEVLITMSEKDIARQLLDNYGFQYTSLGSYGKGIVKKILNLPVLDLRMWKAVRKFNPDLFIGFSPIRASHISFLMHKKTIAIDDSEHAKYEHFLYRPFTDIIMTPACFEKDFGKKQIRFNGYTELFYLHPKRFSPNPDVLTELGLREGDIFFVLRFVSFDANHDIGQSGIHDKIRLVKLLSTYGRVIITSEGELPKELEEYRYRAPVHKMHDLLYYATLFIGEGATMASEAACLGTHAVYINTIHLGYLTDEENKYGLVTSFSDANMSDDIILSKVEALVTDPDINIISRSQRNKLIADSCDPTNEIINYIEGCILKK